MSGYSKKEQKKSIFTVKRNSEGNIVVSRASGQNGGEIRGSILRTNEGMPYLVSGKGISILSGSNTGHPGPGQVQLQVDVDDIKAELYTLVSSFGISGTPGARGQSGARGSDGSPGTPGANGDQGLAGAAGAGITLIETEPSGELVITYGSTGAVITTDPLVGPDGAPGADGAAGADGAVGADGTAGIGFEAGDTYSFYAPLLSSNRDKILTTGSASSVAGELYELEISRTIFNSDDFQIASATRALSWSLMFNVNDGNQDADETWQFLYKIQYWDVATMAWVDSTSDTYPPVYTPAPISLTTDQWAGSMTFVPPGSGEYVYRLVCSAKAIDSTNVVMTSTFTAKTYMARIKVQYTIP
jgi:hypothetical protein